MQVIDVESFSSPVSFLDQVTGLIARIKDTPTLPGVDEIRIPGEYAARTKGDRRKNGIYIEEVTWAEIIAVATGISA